MTAASKLSAEQLGRLRDPVGVALRGLVDELELEAILAGAVDKLELRGFRPNVCAKAPNPFPLGTDSFDAASCKEARLDAHTRLVAAVEAARRGAGTPGGGA